MPSTKWWVCSLGSLLAVLGNWNISQTCSIDLESWRIHLRDQTRIASTIIIARIDSTKEEGFAVIDSPLGGSVDFQSWEEMGAYLEANGITGISSDSFRYRLVVSLTLEMVWKGQPRTGSLIMHYLTKDGAACGAGFLPPGWRVLLFLPPGEVLPSAPKEEYYPKFELTLSNTALLNGGLPLEHLLQTDEDVRLIIETLHQHTVVMPRSWGAVKHEMVGVVK